MRIWLAVIKRICSKDNTLSAFMGHKEKGLLNLNLKEKKVTAVASHGKNHNSKIVHKGSATRHSCVDFFFFFFQNWIKLLFISWCVLLLFLSWFQAVSLGISNFWTHWLFLLFMKIIATCIQHQHFWSEDSVTLEPACMFPNKSTALQPQKLQQRNCQKSYRFLEDTSWGVKAERREERPHSKSFQCFP